MNSRILDKILNEVSLDSRVKDGIFNIEENDHMEALRELLSKRGIDEESIREFSNKVLEGKYPERQAYNAKGILVTFPTPEYKADAIKAGTHFEKDPTKGMSNLFQEPSTAAKPPATPPPAENKPAQPKAEPKTNLPVSQADKPESDDTPAPAAQTTAAPQQAPVSPETPPEAVEPTELPPAPPKSPAEKEANKNAIKTMLKGDDYMLEEVVQWIINNGPPHLLESIKRKL